MKLRQYQKDVLNDLVKVERQGNRRIILQAATGSGKTVMAAELAARLIKIEQIDFVLCFSPSTEVNEGIKSFVHPSKLTLIRTYDHREPVMAKFVVSHSP